jgi:hypothetical protein
LSGSCSVPIVWEQAGWRCQVDYEDNLVVGAMRVITAQITASNVGRVESSVQRDETRRQRIEQGSTCPTIAEPG